MKITHGVYEAARNFVLGCTTAAVAVVLAGVAAPIVIVFWRGVIRVIRVLLITTIVVIITVVVSRAVRIVAFRVLIRPLGAAATWLLLIFLLLLLLLLPLLLAPIKLPSREI